MPHCGLRRGRYPVRPAHDPETRGEVAQTHDETSEEAMPRERLLLYPDAECCGWVARPGAVAGSLYCCYFSIEAAPNPFEEP